MRGDPGFERSNLIGALMRLASLRGTWVFVVGVILVLTAGLLADTLTQTTFTTGMSYSTLVTTLNNNITAINNIINGKLTKGNFKAAPSTADKLTIAQINLANSITPAMLDPNSSFISADSTSGVISGYGPLRAKAQTTPDLTLQVGAGAYVAQGAVVVYAGGNSPSLVRPTTNPRVAVLALNYAGAFSDGVNTNVWIYGAEATSPTIPQIPAGLTPLVAVYSRTSAGGCSTITNTDSGGCYVYRDFRPLITDAAFIPSNEDLDYIEHFNFHKDAKGSAFSGEPSHPFTGSSTGCPRSAAPPTGPYIRCSQTGGTRTEMRTEDTLGASGARATHAYLQTGMTYFVEARVKWVDTGTATTMCAGFGSEHGGAPPQANEVCVAEGSAGVATTIALKTCENSVCTTGSDVTWTATSWNVVRVEVSTTAATMFLNGYQVTTQATNIPYTNCDGAGDDCSLRPWFGAKPSSGTHEWLIDYVRWGVKPPYLAP